MISLFAFIVTLGIIVDDAVVMGENIYEKREKGLSALDAAIEGAREIALPITFAVLTNIVAFMPLFFVPGISGKFFRQIPAVVVTVFAVSLIESIFVLPAHLSHKPKDRAIWRLFEIPRGWCASWLDWVIKTIYKPIVARCVKYRYTTFACACSMLLAALGLVAGGHLPFSFLPKIDGELITAQAVLPVGSPIEESRKVRAQVVEAATRALEKSGGLSIAKGIYAQIGGTLIAQGPGPRGGGGAGGNVLAAQVSLVSAEKRNISGGDFARRWKEELGTLVGLESLIFKSDTGASEGAAIEFNLSHGSRAALEAAAIEFVDVMKGYAGVSDTDDGVASGKKQLSFRLTPQARSLGLTSSDIGRQLRSSFYGAEALRQQRGRNEIKVRVRLPEQERESLQTFERMVIRTPQGGEVPLSEVVEIDEGSSYNVINRRNGRRVVTVSADVDSQKGNSTQITSELVENTIPILQRKYPGLTYSFGGEQEAQRDSLSSLGIGFIVALLGIYALLAIPFKSYIQPVVVMLSIPFGIIGAVAGHYLLGYGLSIISMFGIIALSGVVVNDSLVLIITANSLRDDEGLPPEEAVMRAGIRRFRPIILTSLTTFLGLAPMIMETSLQARFLIPMAISIGFGILFATAIILMIVPAAYLIIDDITRVFVGGIRGGHESQNADELELYRLKR